MDVPSCRGIVDTEPADGNVWKMLLGTINPLFDGDGSSTTASNDIATVVPIESAD